MTDGPRCRVLVVEDEAIIAMLLEDMILDFGAEVIGPVATLSAALHLAATAALDAAILDIKMGEAVVFPVADILQSRRIPILFATGYGPASLPPRFRAMPTLSKPFTFETLSSHLRQALAEQPCHTEAA